MHIVQKEKKRTFLHDAVDIISMSTHSLESDDFNRCFQPISRHEMDSSGIFYVFSFFIRYCILLPFRLAFLGAALLIYILLISKALIKKCENEMTFAYIFIIKAVNFIIGARVKHYGEKRNLDGPHLFVSNHTSFVDFILLSNYGRPHACVSENHGGLFYMFFSLILGRNGSIAFKRCERLDRSLVKERMKSHVALNKLPMLVFPEGTCVNNKFSVMFQKGVFELDVDICPVSIRYRRTLMDPYWNRRRHGFAVHLLYLMTRWYIEADIFWLPPVRRNENETPAEFGTRTKNLISQRAEIKNTLWNGYLKSSPAIKDRDLLKVAYIKTYCAIRNNTLKLEHDESLDTTSIYNCIFFEKYNYKEFLNEILKEYHRLKNLPSHNQDSFISTLSSKSTVRFVKKKKCSCNKYLCKKFNKYKFKSCKLDVLKNGM